MSRQPEQQPAPVEVPELPKRLLSTYARLWQLETWLRRMVYVELRALRGDDWDKDVPFAKNSFEADKRLTHMTTPEEESLSYAQLSTLKNVISANWHAFACYLPPHNIWDAKLEEVSQIRHRVAHFRRYPDKPSGLWRWRLELDIIHLIPMHSSVVLDFA